MSGGADVWHGGNHGSTDRGEAVIDRRFPALCLGAALVVIVLLGGAVFISVVDARDEAACDDAGGVYYESLCMEPEALIDVVDWPDPGVHVDTER